MTNINPIKFGIAGNQYYKQEAKEDLTKNTTKEAKTNENQQKQLNSNDVLGFMAAQNADIIPVKTQKTIDVSKYVTPDQEARITAFMQGFEADYDEAFSITADEFPEISEKAAGDIALAYINASY
jgi:hypothetical protein